MKTIVDENMLYVEYEKNMFTVLILCKNNKVESHTQVYMKECEDYVSPTNKDCVIDV